MTKIFSEIRLLEGFDDLHFRMKPIEVSKMLGEPYEVEKLEDEEDFDVPTIIWYYPRLSLTAFFEKQPSELTCFETTDPSVTLFGQRIFDLNTQQVKQLMNVNGFNDLEEETEAWGEHRLSFNDALLDLYYEDNKLVSVNWGILPG
jgi:hypothetical protein